MGGMTGKRNTAVREEGKDASLQISSRNPTRYAWKPLVKKESRAQTSQQEEKRCKRIIAVIVYEETTERLFFDSKALRKTSSLLDAVGKSKMACMDTPQQNQQPEEQNTMES
jgi:hypothetical protein